MIRLLKFDPKRVSVWFDDDTCRTAAAPHKDRRYTLTHNDLTRHLTLTVAQTFNGTQTNNVVTYLLRDEVLAEWCEDGLHVHCQVSVEGHWWISWAKSLRSLVFRQKLPLVLVGRGRYCSPRHRIPDNSASRVKTRFTDVAGNGPRTYCSPRHVIGRLGSVYFENQGFKLRVDDVASNICQAICSGYLALCGAGVADDGRDTQTSPAASPTRVMNTRVSS